MITQELVRELFIYDPLTGIMTARVKRGKLTVGKIAGCMNDKGYWVIHINGKQYKRYNLAWLYVHGKLPEDELDHSDRVRDNDRLGNLRDVTRAVNNSNRGYTSPPNKLGFTGVSKNKKGFQARLRVDGEKRNLGTYESAEEAGAVVHAAKEAVKIGIENFFKNFLPNLRVA